MVDLVNTITVTLKNTVKGNLKIIHDINPSGKQVIYRPKFSVYKTIYKDFAIYLCERLGAGYI